jgi:serine protease Do
LAARLLPTVVNITATKEAAARPARPSGSGVPFDRRFQDFMHGGQTETPPPPRGTQSLGSGFIVDPSGLIVTNNHVIGGADSVSVTLQDGTTLKAKIVGRDRSGDLALLRVDAGRTLPAVQWGRSASARVGNWVIAIGNPFGLGGTVTAGIVSARGRDIHDGHDDDFIQTDAPINRGNSGGPLFDLAGRVIGVNTAIYSPSGGSVGIGFAIPADIARSDIAQLEAYGHPRRGWLGLQAEPVTADIARALGLPRAGGALVAAVAPAGPAAMAGLRPGDIILRFAGSRLKTATLPRRVADAPPGSTVALRVWRDGQAMTLNARLAVRPAAARVASPARTDPGGGNLHPARR